MSLENLINKDRPTKEVLCIKHNVAYTSTNYIGDHWTECPKCMIEIRDAEAKKQIERDKQAELERQQRRWIAKIGKAAIPERFKDRTLDSYIAKTSGQQTALAFCKEYANNFDEVLKTGRSAIFCGRVGTGKTHLAIGIALSIMQQQRSPVFVTVQRLIRRVKDSWHTKEETESEVIEAFASPDLLILDEIGLSLIHI